MSYWQDHGIEKKELLNRASSSAINPNVNHFFTGQLEGLPFGQGEDGQQRLEFLQFLQQTQQRNQQQGLGSENIDSILNQLFQEAQQSAKGTPPASKDFISNLPLLDESSAASQTCSICMESFDEQTRTTAHKLPCRHCFHRACIVPWLQIHNTCPSCRTEFPTDDVEYERKKRKALEEQIRKEDSEEEWDPFYS